MAVTKSAVSVWGRDAYKSAHGTYPKGYGNWAFRINRQEYWFTGMYTEAKKQAIEKAVELGVFNVRVLT